MTTRREYLVSLGLAKPGRGKFSHAANVALISARDKGMKFSDDDKPVKVVSDKPAKPKASTPKPVGIVTDIAYTYPEAEYKAIEIESGKVRSMREVCMTCGVSLVVHGCLSPVIVSRNASGTARVRIVAV